LSLSNIRALTIFKQCQNNNYSAIHILHHFIFYKEVFETFLKLPRIDIRKSIIWMLHKAPNALKKASGPDTVGGFFIKQSK